MKKLLLLAAITCSIGTFAQIRMPAPSSTQKITQDFGLGSIELVYSRPTIKGRSIMKENSELVPLNKLWRTGANAATKIKFTDKVTIGGKALDTGTYVLYTIPGKDNWEVILNKGVNNWGTDGYKEAEDVVRFTVKADKLSNAAETYTMQFTNIQPESCELHLMWANADVRIPISTNIKDRIRAQVEKTISAEKVSANAYATAATFYYEWDKDLNKALTNIGKAIQANPQGASFYITQARIQKSLGDKVSAKASAEKAIQLATATNTAEYINLGNQILKTL